MLETDQSTAAQNVEALNEEGQAAVAAAQQAEVAQHKKYAH